ncbi:MAG: chemotaxis protein CheD [Methanocalculus sp. MSAO_Arc1]|uniref:chemotaxis protein CheD n=1 Tax=Methanocalculus TaxID=71151 RepID=UPI000FF0DB19|nr:MULTISPECIES: chemotaxis protein CheD [unclassified Methanocalculus]MCP1661938.1 chemotaxis protein CheD [Methanocalculus sp. AMF5]RQD80548.1 MAG: chemotaxis protein CheD [Methanocalculus sp. MSAO_Arc1]
MDTQQPGNEPRAIVIGIGDYHVGAEPMTSIGLGSCIGLILHDSKLGIGAMAHIMLPESGGKKDRPGKYADTALEIMLRDLARKGSSPKNLQAKLVGGAQMFANFSGNLSIGDRNAEAVKAGLKSHGIPIKGEDIGGSKGRTVQYCPANGFMVKIRRADGDCSEI